MSPAAPEWSALVSASHEFMGSVGELQTEIGSRARMPAQTRLLDKCGFFPRDDDSGPSAVGQFKPSAQNERKTGSEERQSDPGCRGVGLQVRASKPVVHTHPQRSSGSREGALKSLSS
jgi:hypothetical protein